MQGKISEMFYKRCPWCDKEFKDIGSKLVGIDMAGPGSPILWFHESCKREWEQSDVNFKWDGKKIIHVRDSEIQN